MMRREELPDNRTREFPDAIYRAKKRNNTDNKAIVFAFFGPPLGSSPSKASKVRIANEFSNRSRGILPG
jgi:hypothetical protein